MKLLVPVYDLELVGQAAAIARTCPTVAIANPWSGPGLVVGSDWRDAISDLRRAGAQVLRYVDAKQQPGDGPHGKDVKSGRLKTVAELAAEARIWNLASADGWFWDDATADTWGRVNEVRGKLPGLHFINPGSGVAASPPWASAVVIWEADGFGKKSPCKFEALAPARCASMALGCGDVVAAVKIARKRQHGYFYATELRDGGNVYDRLPAKISRLAQLIRES